MHFMIGIEPFCLDLYIFYNWHGVEYCFGRFTIFKIKRYGMKRIFDIGLVKKLGGINDSKEED